MDHQKAIPLQNKAQKLLNKLDSINRSKHLDERQKALMGAIAKAELNEIVGQLELILNPGLEEGSTATDKPSKAAK